MDISPYLSAVQSLPGENPGEKHNGLHEAAVQIINNAEEREEFIKTGATSRVKPALLPYLRIVVGNKLKLDEFVIEALKSDDVTVVRQALKARWFFSGSSPSMEVSHFVERLVPQMSMRTRLAVVKTLAHCLMKDSEKAESFFSSFADRYGVEQSLPLIVACSEDYIFQETLRRRIHLPARILTPLYRHYPLLVIRYLQLGNEDNRENESDRKLIRVRLDDYVSFLPQLVKNHTREFIELYECRALGSRTIKLGSTRAEFFLKSATDALIKRPLVFLDMLPLKIVSNMLTTQQFDAMFENILGNDRRRFRVRDVIKYLQYYPEEKKLDLLIGVYKRRYAKDLLDQADTIFSVKEMYKLLPVEVKEERARKYVESFKGKEEYNDYVRYLPPSESVPILTEKIGRAKDMDSRSRYIEHMILSCSLYDSTADLLKVLKYYNTRHKNELPVVLHQVLGTLVQQFDIAKLDKDHWQILKDIIQRSNIRGDLDDAPSYTYERLFSGALRYYIKRCQEAGDKEDEMFLDKLVQYIIELFLERNMKWDFIIETPDVGPDCLRKFLVVIDQMYPEGSSVWDSRDNKVTLASYLLRTMQSFNAKGEVRKRKRKKAWARTSDSTEPRLTRFAVRDYPWLKNLAYSLLKPQGEKMPYGRKRALLRFAKMLRLHDAELYQSLIDGDDEMTNDVETEDALLLLKRDPGKILAKWKQYVEACRVALEHGRRSTQVFVMSMKWHRELPVKIVEACAAEMEVKGNALILGLLLEGEVLEKLITPYLPKKAHIDLDSSDAKSMYEITASLPRAMNLTNPPVSFDVLSKFCQGDYLLLALQSLPRLAQRAPVEKVLAFVNKHVSNKPFNVKKQAIRMVLQVATREESREFLLKLWNEEDHYSVREILTRMILDLFKKSPNQATWDLLKACINELTPDSDAILDSLECVDEIDTEYVALYLQEFIRKLDSFTEEELTSKKRLYHFGNIVYHINVELIQHLPEELVRNIVERYLLHYSASFTVGIFLISDTEKFEARLRFLIQKILEELGHFDEPNKERPRYFRKNREVRDFFDGLTKYVFKENGAERTRSHLRLLYELRLLFNAPLRPWNEPQSYMQLHLCTNYFEVETPFQYGEKCATTAMHLVNVFESELILEKLANVLGNQVLTNNDVFSTYESADRRLLVMQGMMNRNARIGALVGIKMLSHYESCRYDVKFDQLMRVWRAMNDPIVQAVLYEFVNTGNEMYHPTVHDSSPSLFLDLN